MPQLYIGRAAEWSVANRLAAMPRFFSTLRDRLSPPGRTPPTFDGEALTGHAQTVQSGFIAGAVLSVIVAIAANQWIASHLVLAWFSAVIIAHLARGMVARVIADLGASVPTAVWEKRLVACELAFGLAFAALFVLPAPADPNFVVFLFGVVLAEVAVGAVTGSRLPSAVAAGIFPIVLAGASVFALAGGFLGVVMAVFSVVAGGFLLILSARLHQTARAMLDFRIEKDALIAELEQAKAFSDESRRRAEEANLAKSRFLATMSHELRTPLNAILGFSEVMQAEVFGPLGSPHYEEYVRDINTSGRHLLDLISEILDLSRIEAGRYVLAEEDVCLPDLAEGCQQLIRLKAATKSIVVRAHFEADLPKVRADERAVRQIVLNLLTNAVKFTQPGGSIDVRVGWTLTGGQYVSVRDNGPGIPEDEIPVVLSAFGQGSIAIKTAEQGTGLGLPIVQALIGMHGGRMELRSAIGHGTEVTVFFPAGRVLDDAPVVAPPKPVPIRPRKTSAPGQQRRRA